MNNRLDLSRLTEGRKQELSRMVDDFSEKGCLFVEDLFMDMLIDYDKGLDRTDDSLVATFDDECGNELVFILSHEEINFVVNAVSAKLDSMTVDDGGGGAND